jgi:ferredoxin
MKAIVDEKCIGCGFCAETCPEVFEMRSDNLAHVKVEVVPLEREDSCREAAAGCPVEAIELKE